MKSLLYKIILLQPLCKIGFIIATVHEISCNCFRSKFPQKCIGDFVFARKLGMPLQATQSRNQDAATGEQRC